MSATTVEADSSTNDQTRAQRFLINVLWNWLSVIASFFTGFFLSPYIIRKLGDARYGIWALAFAFIDYYQLFDFGFKTAIVNMISRLRAQNEERQINEVINTAFFYFLSLSVFIFGLTWYLAGELNRFLKISPLYQAEFVVLIRIIGVGWSTGIALSVFQATVEGFQRFKAANHIWILSLVIRSGGCALMLYLGHGLMAMGVVVTVAQFICFSLIFLTAKRAFPAMHLSPSLARFRVWKQIASYGVHAFLAGIGNMLLTQGPPVLVGHFKSEAFVGYYTLPSRLLQYVVELVTRIGYVTMPNTAEMAALGKRREIVTLGTYLNRYCLALFLPLSVFLIVYGRELIRVWVGQGFAMEAGPLLPVFVVSTTLAIAGQFNSSVILFGLSKHDSYAKSLIVEGALMLGGMAIVLPKYGIFGAACVAASLAIVNRGIVTPYLVCRALDFSLWRYLYGIYTIPLLLSVPTIFYAYWLKAAWLHGNNWIELIVVIGLIAIPYYAVTYFTAITRDHRLLLHQWVRARIRGVRVGGGAAVVAGTASTK